MLAFKKPKLENKLTNGRNQIPKLVHAERFKKAWQPEQRFTPEGVCFAPQLGALDGIVIATDSISDCLVAFRKCQEPVSLECCFTFGFSGKAAGRFSGPYGICVQPITNHLIVADTYNHRLQVPSIDCSISATDLPKRRRQQPILFPLFMIGAGNEDKRNGSQKLGEFHRPRGVCCTHSGDIFVADSGNNRVQLYDCKGKVVRKVGSNIDCKSSDAKDCFNYPQAVALEAARPHGFTSSRRLIVADTNNHSLSLWDQDGKQHIANVGVRGCPTGVCVDLNGHIVVNSNNHTIQIYDPINLKLLQVFGTPGGEGSEPGRFDDPRGLCVDDDNNLYVCDRWNHRLQVF